MRNTIKKIGLTVTAGHLGALVGAAVPTLCPEHIDQLPSAGGGGA